MNSVVRLRLSMIIGAALILLFMIADLELLPPELDAIYATNRLVVQLPMVAFLLAISFHRTFRHFRQCAFLLTILGLTYANYYLIHKCWQLQGFSFPYEGTLLYAFFGFFVMGLSFRYALMLMVVSSLGFVVLTTVDPVYGDRTAIANGFVLGSLFIGVIGRYGIDSLMHRLRQANEQLAELSALDPLTGLLNRRALMAESEKLVTMAQRAGEPLGVFMLDIDSFKQFNDRYGHQAGDRVIVRQAEILAAVFRRKIDVIGRYGGEEFLVIASGLEQSECKKKARAILQQWQESGIPNDGAQSHRIVTCSIGVGWLAAGSEVSLDEMIRLSDMALYEAKAKGRNTFQLTAPGDPNNMGSEIPSAHKGATSSAS